MPSALPTQSLTVTFTIDRETGDVAIMLYRTRCALVQNEAFPSPWRKLGVLSEISVRRLDILAEMTTIGTIKQKATSNCSTDYVEHSRPRC